MGHTVRRTSCPNYAALLRSTQTPKPPYSALCAVRWALTFKFACTVQRLTGGTEKSYERVRAEGQRYSPQNRLFYCYGPPRRKTTVKTRAKPIQGGLSAPNPLFLAYFAQFPAYNSQKPANLNKGPHRTAHKLPKLRGPATINALAQTTAYRTARRPVGPNVQICMHGTTTNRRDGEKL